jgi:hypothetical protein
MKMRLACVGLQQQCQRNKENQSQPTSRLQLQTILLTPQMHVALCMDVNKAPTTIYDLQEIA